MASHLELLAFCLDEKGNWVGLMRICAEILELGRGPRGLAASHLEKELFFFCIFIISSFLSFQNTLESFYVACLWTVWLCLKSQSRDLSRSNAHKNRDEENINGELDGPSAE